MDTNLRKRIRAGDHNAFGDLFDAYARSVYNHAFRLTGEWSTAEDVVSLTFLDAWRLRERLDEEGGSLRPWLLGIATNVTRNTRRTARRHAAAVARLPPAEDVRDFADDVGRGWTTRRNWPPYGPRWRSCGGPSGKCWRCACGRGWATRRRPRRWGCPSGPYDRGFRGRGQNSRNIWNRLLWTDR